MTRRRAYTALGSTGGTGGPTDPPTVWPPGWPWPGPPWPPAYGGGTYLGLTYNASTYTISATFNTSVTLIVESYDDYDLYTGTTFSATITGGGYRALYVLVDEGESLGEITSLTLAGTRLVSVDLDNLTMLDTLDLSGNAGLTTVDFSALINIVDCDIGQCGLTGSFSASDFDYLESLDIADNALTGLDVSNSTLLATMDYSGNSDIATWDFTATPITTLDLSAYASTTTVDVTDCISLATLDLNGLSSLDSLTFSGCVSLVTVDIGQCGFTGAFSVTGFTSLTALDIADNAITSLDLTNCTSLATLDLTGCSSLTTVDFTATALTSLDLSGLSAMETVDVTDCTALTSLDLNGLASLTSVTLTGCTALVTLDGSSSSIDDWDEILVSSLLNIDLSSCSISSANVDAILGVVEAWGTSNGTIDLLTNSIPSASGFVDKTTLEGRGWTVNVDTTQGYAVTVSTLNVTRGVAFNLTVQGLLVGEVDFTYSPSSELTVSFLGSDASDSINVATIDTTGWTNGSKTVAVTLAGGLGSDTAQITVSGENGSGTAEFTVAATATNIASSWDSSVYSYGATGNITGVDDADAAASEYWNTVAADHVTAFDVSLRGNVVGNGYGDTYVIDQYSYVSMLYRHEAAFYSITASAGVKAAIKSGALNIQAANRIGYYNAAYTDDCKDLFMYNGQIRLILTEDIAPFVDGADVRDGLGCTEWVIGMDELAYYLSAHLGYLGTNTRNMRTNQTITIPLGSEIISFIQNMSGTTLFVGVMIELKVPSYTTLFTEGTWGSFTWNNGKGPACLFKINSLDVYE